MSPAVVVLLLVVLPVGMLGAVLRVQYASWPPLAWKRRLAAHLARQDARRDELDVGTAASGTAIDRLERDHLRRHLQAIRLDRLADYPGIGPGTLDRLAAAGFRTLADAERAAFDGIPGVGPSRANDLRAAVAALLRESRSAFAAGGCPEGQAFRRAAAELRAEAAARAAAVAPERAAVDAARAACRPLEDVAREVTFGAWLFGRGASGLTDELMARPLPQPVVRPVAPTRPAAATPLPPPPPALPAAVVVARPVARSQPPAPPAPLPAAEPARLDQMRAVAGLGVAMARVDGRVARAERAAVRAFLGDWYGHDPVLARHFDPLLERLDAAPPDLSAALAAVRRACPPDQWPRLHAFAASVADAAGGVGRREAEALAEVASALGLSPESIVPASDAALPKRPHLLLSLGVAVAASAGRVGPAEAAVLTAYLGTKLRGLPDARDRIPRALAALAADPPTVAAAAAAVRSATNAADKAELLDVLGRLAGLDGAARAARQAAVAAVADAFRLSALVPGPAARRSEPADSPPPVVVAPTAPRSPPPPPPAGPDPRAVLDIHPGAELTVELVRRKFALAVDKLDPAKAAALGDEFARLAAAKRAAARAAAEALLAPLGAPLDPPPAPPPPADPRHNPDLDAVFGD